MSDSYKVYASQEYVNNKIQEIDTSVDWNAKEGEPGYVENRTHYEEGIGVFELDASCLEGAKDLLTTTSTSSIGTDSYIKITDKIITLEECEAAKIILVKPSGETVDAINREVLASLNGEYIYQWQYLYNQTKVNVTCVYVNTPGDKKFLFEAAGINYLTSAVAKESGFYITDDIQTAFVVVGDAGYSKVILNFGEYTIKTLDPKYLAAAPSNSKTTILPKITLTVSDSDNPGDGVPITTPFAEYPSAGDTWNITYNGIEYACELIDASTIPDIELPFPEGAVYFGGNLTATGFEHIASNNDAPFVIMAIGSEEFAVEMEAYGMIMPIVTLDQTFTVSIAKGSEMAPSQLTLRSNGEMVWEERPFYEEKSEVVLVPLTECIMVEDDDSNGLNDTYKIPDSLLTYPTIGAKGIITINGVDYESDFMDSSPLFEEDMPEDWNVILCGNAEMIGLSGGNSDAPFVCMLCGNEATAQMIQAAGAVFIYGNELEGQDITIGIKTVETKIKKLDSKFIDVEMPYYLPSSVPTENTLILPQTSLEGKFETSAFGRVASNFTDYDFQLKDGHEYTIVCDGAEYKAICSYRPGDMDLSSGWMLSTNGQSNLTASVDKGIIIWKSETGASVFGKNSIFTYLEISNIAIKDEAKFVSHLNTKLISDYPSALIQGSDVHSVQHRNARSASSGGFAWGIDCQATGGSAVAWGEQVKAYAVNAFARGRGTQIHGQNSSSFGSNNIIRGANAFVIGSNHNINSDNVFVAGRSSLDNSNAAYILGNGDSATSVKSNASIVDWSGNGYFAGDLYVNGDGQTIGFDGAKKVATEEYVDTKVSDLVNTAPEALDTLKELSSALGDDPNFATTVLTELGNKANKTITINGKALSDNIALTAADVGADASGSASSALDSAKEYTDTVASGKSDTSHNHDSAYDKKGAANTALTNAKSYTDSEIFEWIGNKTVAEQISAIPSPDWNAAEGEPGHVLNRTHYVDGVRSEVLIPEISAVIDDQGFPIEGLIQPFPSDGDVFTVIYNGVAYKRDVIIQNLWEDGSSFAAILGNPIVAGAGEDNGDPFTVMICDEATFDLMGCGAILFALDNTNASTVTMSVSYEIENVHKLDKKYISEHSHKWSDIKDTPFTKIFSDTLYCATGEKVEIEEQVFTKVSNIVPTADDCKKGMQVLVRAGVGNTIFGEYPVSIDGSSIVVSQDGLAEITISSYGTIIIIPHDNYSMDGTIIQDAGMYVCTSELYYCVYSITIPGSALFPRQILNPIYLPEDIGGGNDSSNGLPTVTTSDNGAFLRVVGGQWKAVKLSNAEDGEF